MRNNARTGKETLPQNRRGVPQAGVGKASGRTAHIKPECSRCDAWPLECEICGQAMCRHEAGIVIKDGMEIEKACIECQEVYSVKRNCTIKTRA